MPQKKMEHKNLKLAMTNHQGLSRIFQKTTMMLHALAPNESVLFVGCGDLDFPNLLGSKTRQKESGNGFIEIDFSIRTNLIEAPEQSRLSFYN
mmetsp:Transcript_1439/g.1956  ORF Transcript_1439/g.1956 Transcript_1439/m.1956 type:complete len:93 (+) Transcript_1439:2583-2861(+)